MLDLMFLKIILFMFFPHVHHFFTVEKIRMASKVFSNTKIVFYTMKDFNQQ